VVKNSVIDNISLDGGVLCLDFTNTINNRFEEQPQEYLSGFEDLLYWSKRLEAIDAKTYKDIISYASAHPVKAADFFKQSMELRELLHRMFLAVSKGEIIEAADLKAFNSILAEYCTTPQIKHLGNNYRESWECEEGFHEVTGPIVQSAYKLLLSDKLNRVKECPNCGWLFLDTTKNGKRRWCSMQSCGSNVKATEYYYRKKAENN
jgi:predicted RNA-binding Zn ribbon-like protein